MKLFPMFLIIFWVIIIFAPAILAWLIWWFFIFVWVSLLSLFKKVKSNKEDYVKFGKYKIYR